MRRVVLVMLLAITVGGCKTSGLIPSKFEGGSWSLTESLSNFVQVLVGDVLGPKAGKGNY